MTDTTADFSKINEIIEDTKVAMLVTTDNELSMHSRPMFTVDVDADNNIWFFTRDDSGKVAELIQDHHVNLTYACPKSGHYLSISGEASFSNDRQRKEELFGFFSKAWFPQGVDDPDLLMIKVKPSKAEYWDTAASKWVQLFKITQAIITNETYDGGDHGRVNQF